MKRTNNLGPLIFFLALLVVSSEGCKKPENVKLDCDKLLSGQICSKEFDPMECEYKGVIAKGENKCQAITQLRYEVCVEKNLLIKDENQVQCQ